MMAQNPVYVMTALKRVNKMAEMFAPRFMIAAPNSGSGKTTITCALLKALLNQEYKVAAFNPAPIISILCSIHALSALNHGIWICLC